MWYLKHPVAVWANAKDGRSGHFFEGRFRVTRMESLEQLLNTMIYNDLNPIRAGLARSIADSNYTSGQLRFHGRKIRQETAEMSPEEAERALTEFCEREKIHTLVDRWLSPVELREEDPILPLEAELLREQQEKAAMEAALVAAGFEAADIEAAMASETENAADAAIPAEPSASGLRASDRGVLPISEEKYLMLLDIMGRREKNGKSGKIPAELPPILSELGIETPEAWLKMYDAFAESIQEIYHGKVNDDREAAMVKLPLIDDRKTNQDAML